MIRMKVNMDWDDAGSGTTWHCATCGIDVEHRHVPKRPTYEALVTELRLLEEQIGKQYKGPYQYQTLYNVNREAWVDLKNLIARVDNGR